MAIKNQSVTEQYKCYLCPAKSFMRDEPTSCSKCPAKFHKSCAQRAKLQKDGSFLVCCGKKVINSLEPVSSNEVGKNAEFKQFAPLWDKLKPYLDSFSESFARIDGEISNHSKMLEDVIERLDENEDKIESITDELQDLRDTVCSGPVKDQLLVKEIMEQRKRESNFIIFNYPDSKDAYKTDTKSIKEIISGYTKEKAPFNSNAIKTSRMGKYIKDKCRPLVVELKKKEHVHWFFVKKKELFKDDVRLSSDLTKSQRDCYQIINQERKDRIEKGELDLVIKFIDGFPTIVKKRNSNENSNSSKN